MVSKRTRACVGRWGDDMVKGGYEGIRDKWLNWRLIKARIFMELVTYWFVS